MRLRPGWLLLPAVKLFSKNSLLRPSRPENVPTEVNGLEVPLTIDIPEIYAAERIKKARNARLCLFNSTFSICVRIGCIRKEI